MATHSSLLAWEIPWTGDPGRLVHGVHKESDILSDYHHTTIMSLVVVVMHGCESWTIKKAKLEIITDFEL